MKRKEILEKQGIKINPEAMVRVIIASDVTNEADDPYAIMHQLLSAKFDVRGIVACHYESKAPGTRTTMEKSYAGLLRLMEAAQIDDVPCYKGSDEPLRSVDAPNESEGADFIISEALRDDERPLFVMCLGGLTDVASAIIKEPAIAGRLHLAWTGGAEYPAGGKEFNLKQDVRAAQVVFDSQADLYQLPINVYNAVNTSLAELRYNVYPCGTAGRYLYEELEAYSYGDSVVHRDLRSGENWMLADLCVAWTLLDAQTPDRYDLVDAPTINDDMTYGPSDGHKQIRVYHTTDTRSIFADLFAKLALCYR